MPSKIGGRAGDRSGVTATVASVETATTIAIGGGEIQLDPECTLRVYPWQNLNHDLEETNQTLRNRYELERTRKEPGPRIISFFSLVR